MSLSDKMEAFVQRRVLHPTETGEESAIAAGYAPKSARFRASKLRARDDVSAAIEAGRQELADRVMERSAVEAADVIDRLWREATEDENPPGTRVQALGYLRSCTGIEEHVRQHVSGELDTGGSSIRLADVRARLGDLEDGELDVLEDALRRVSGSDAPTSGMDRAARVRWYIGRLVPDPHDPELAEGLRDDVLRHLEEMAGRRSRGETTDRVTELERENARLRAELEVARGDGRAAEGAADGGPGDDGAGEDARDRPAPRDRKVIALPMAVGGNGRAPW